MTELPAPPVPADLDLRAFRRMPLDVDALRNSSTARKASGDAFRAAVLLWCASWHEIPASSLPDDDTELALIAGYGRGGEEPWAAIRDAALAGFIKCSDGRLYHPFIADVAMDAAAKMRKNQNRTAAATAARVAKRNGKRDVGHAEQRGAKPEETSRTLYIDRNDPEIIDVTSTKGMEGNRIEGKSEPSHSPTPVLREAGLGLDWDVIEARLRAAADWQNEISPGLCVVGPIIALIEAGANLDLDVLPTVRALAPKCRGRTSWKFFLDAIKDARDLRISMGTASIPRSFTNGKNRVNSIADGFAEINAALDERIRCEGGNPDRPEDPGSLPRLRQGAA